jgi:hypothetical protein
MCIRKLLFFLLIGLTFFKSLPGINPEYYPGSQTGIFLSVNDTLNDRQILYNGRVWRNRYYMVMEDQFFLSKDFIPGSITIAGKTFDNLNVRYDIFSDQLLTPLNHGPVIQLNKEMIDSFSLTFMNKKWRFVNIKEDSLNLYNGYVNVLYKGKSDLYVKYSKEIALLAVDKKYDKFYQLQKIYLVKNNIVNQISGKRNFLKLFGDDEQAVKDYIRKNKLVLSKKNPESFVPVICFYDNLR